MQVAVVGSSGYISMYLQDLLLKERSDIDVVRIGRAENSDFFLDLERSEDFNYDQLEEIEYILFTAAISGPDKCAQEFN